MRSFYPLVFGVGWYVAQTCYNFAHNILFIVSKLKHFLLRTYYFANSWLSQCHWTFNFLIRKFSLNLKFNSVIRLMCYNRNYCKFIHSYSYFECNLIHFLIMLILYHYLNFGWFHCLLLILIHHFIFIHSFFINFHL